MRDRCRAVKKAVPFCGQGPAHFSRLANVLRDAVEERGGQVRQGLVGGEEDRDGDDLPRRRGVLKGAEVGVEVVQLQLGRLAETGQGVLGGAPVEVGGRQLVASALNNFLEEKVKKNSRFYFGLPSISFPCRPLPPSSGRPGPPRPGPSGRCAAPAYELFELRKISIISCEQKEKPRG